MVHFIKYLLHKCDDQGSVPGIRVRNSRGAVRPLIPTLGGSLGLLASLAKLENCFQ